MEKTFEKLDEARKWVFLFTGFYNGEHRYSAIKFVTSAQKHRGDDRETLNRRDRIAQKAQKKNPERWSGETPAWMPNGKVTLNLQKKLSITTYI
ncbi:MAG: hypothetical protein ACYCT9_09250 [Leptospirillum sp.]